MKDNHSSQGFNSNFFMGAILGAAGLYLLGTKNGRTILKKLMDSVEQLEDSAENIFEVIEEQVGEGLDIESLAEDIHINNKKETPPSASLHSVIEKIKSSISLKEVKNNKKYFSKDGMIVK